MSFHFTKLRNDLNPSVPKIKRAKPVVSITYRDATGEKHTLVGDEAEAFLRERTCQEDIVYTWEDKEFGHTPKSAMVDSTYSTNMEELSLMGGEAQDANGNFIPRENDPKDHVLQRGYRSPVFNRMQNYILRQSEIEAKQE
jgi:hypothetical protein